jgi:hypothetical protein
MTFWALLIEKYDVVMQLDAAADTRNGPGVQLASKP